MADKIKISQIRERFPMYADVPDHTLLGAIHKKFYSDIPRMNFLQSIDYDTQRRDPTEGMSTWEKTAAGWGKAVTDIGRGLGQFVGAVSREDVADSRQRDEALMKTTAGKVGNIAGNVGTMLPLAFVPGANTMVGAAAIGAGTGLAAPSVSTEETLKNAGIGGALGPLSVLGGRAIGAAYQGAKGLIDPFTKSGQERIAAKTLQTFATDPAKAAAALRSAREFVPGSAPTMAQAADDAGIAQLERSLMNNPETGGKLAEAYGAQRAARVAALQGVAGDATKRAAAVAEREAAAKPLYDQATRAVYEMDPAIQRLLQTPIGRQALERAKGVAANQQRPFQFTTETSAPFSGVGGRQAETTRQVTGQALQDIKMALDDMLSNPMSGIAKSEADAVKGLRGKLVDWMEKSNEAFKGARTTYAEKSIPINTMDVGEDLMKRLQGSLGQYGATTKELSGAYAKALDGAKESVKKTIGIDRPMESVIDPAANTLFENVAKDLARKVKAEDLGRAAGSNTAQNLAAQNLLRRVLGPSGLPQTWSENTMLHAFLSPFTGVAKLSGSEQKVLDRLLQATLDPADAAGLLAQAAKPISGLGLLGQRVEPMLPALAGSGLLSYRAQ